MDQAPLGGKPKRKNQNAQAKQQADALKKAEAESSSQITNEPTYKQVFHDIRKDWNSGFGLIIGHVLDQGDKDICWAICFARLLQAIHNIEHPNDYLEFSYNDLILCVKPDKSDKLALSNLNKAFKFIKKDGMLKMPTTRHGATDGGDQGKRVNVEFKLYEHVDASYIQQRLNSFPVALRLQTNVIFSSNHGQIYHLPKKTIIVDNGRPHCILLIGYGMTKEGKLYFIGQNSWGTGWGCGGYIPIVIEEECDIICLKH